jgi:predicted nucleotidyltransferase
MNADAVASIDARLSTVRQEHHVAIPLAIESGSRAWGFPSPDSDYDCRFIFVRRMDDYLSLYPLRDVIETPIQGVMDINGWDLAKALKLLLNGNAVVIEWLTSPIIYCADERFHDAFNVLASRLADRELVARHYLHLGERQRHAYFADSKQFQLKKLFYALRPAAALRWLRLHPGEAVAPMHFPTLLDGCDAPSDIRTLTNDLIARKAVTRELGVGELPPEVAAFIDCEFEAAKTAFDPAPRPPSESARMEIQQFFRETLSRYIDIADA